MQHVWFLFKFCEFIMGSICLTLHILGLDEVEPIPHVIFYCGTFFGFTLITFFGSLGILLGRGSKPLMEAIISATGAAMYITASLLAMYHAEKDLHLMYLSDFEEPLHAFFRHCKQQSIAALVTGLLFLLHCTFALDLCIVRHRHISIFEDENEEAIQPLCMYFISKTVQKYLERYEWFRHYSKREFPQNGDFQERPYRGESSITRNKHYHRRSAVPLQHRSSNASAVAEPSVIVSDNAGKMEGSSSLSTTSLATSQICDRSEIV